MAISTAIPLSLRSRVVGYQLFDKIFNPQAGNLPMRIALLGEPNDADEPTISTAPYQPTSLADVGAKYGIGCPIYEMYRILSPVSGGGVGSIPIVIYPQEYSTTSPPTASEIIKGIVVATTVTKTVTHILRINGRDNIDGKSYAYTVTKGDSATEVIAAIVSVVTGVLAAPCSAVGGVANITFGLKWKGASGADFNIEFDTQGESAGIVYSEIGNTPGTGTPDIAPALALFGAEWNTFVVNPYGSVKLAELEAFNGTIAEANGRYSATDFKPFQAYFGSTLDTVAALTAITNDAARRDQQTNILSPAPNSKGFAFEAAANMCVTMLPISSDKPHVGYGGRSYPDMPIPLDSDIGDMSELNNRNTLMIAGCSTCILENGKYTIQDYVNTFAPDGVSVPKFASVRALVIDWNVEYNWRIIVVRDIQDKTLIADDQTVTVDDTISPKQVKALLAQLIQDASDFAWLVDVAFSEDNIKVGVSGTNPVRLDISFPYKRTSPANQVSTDASVDFAYNL